MAQHYPCDTSSAHLISALDEIEYPLTHLNHVACAIGVTGNGLEKQELFIVIELVDSLGENDMKWVIL